MYVFVFVCSSVISVMCVFFVRVYLCVVVFVCVCVLAAFFKKCLQADR